MVVIVTCYMMFVTSLYDIIFTFANQWFDEVVDTTCTFRDAETVVGQVE